MCGCMHIGFQNGNNVNVCCFFLQNGGANVALFGRLDTGRAQCRNKRYTMCEPR
jgi:hypothetical protein